MAIKRGRGAHESHRTPLWAHPPSRPARQPTPWRSRGPETPTPTAATQPRVWVYLVPLVKLCCGESSVNPPLGGATTLHRPMQRRQARHKSVPPAPRARCCAGTSECPPRHQRTSGRCDGNAGRDWRWQPRPQQGGRGRSHARLQRKPARRESRKANLRRIMKRQAPDGTNAHPKGR